MLRERGWVIKAISTSVFCCFIIIGLHAQGFLRADGKRIVDGSGKEIILRGMGLGGWMLQEGYMLKLNGSGQQHTIKKRIEALIGPEKTNEFYNKWLANAVQKADIDSMKKWGFNSVRLAMHYNLYTLPIEQEPVAGENTWLPKGFAMTDSLLQWCKANNMYLILDLHAAPGGQGSDLNISDGDTSKPSLWDSEANRDKTIALWIKLAARYANEPYIGAYDILNEPNYGFTDPDKDKNGLSEQRNEPLKKLYLDITNAIRSVDKNHIIIIEGNGWGNNYNGMLPTWDNNMVLSFHKYWNFNDEESIRKILTFRQLFNVPVWLGETGENSNVWFTEAIHLLESNNIGWAWWPLKKIGFNNPLEIPAPKGYDKLLSYWAGKGPKPDAATAYQVLMQLAANAKIENNIYHKDVTDAMFRQPFSNETIPFKNHVINNNTVVNAADYDLGKNGYAYFDMDTANYRVSNKPGVGNRGHVYRNDGVDIYSDTTEANTYYVGNIEAGEWLQYTLNVAKKGNYKIVFAVRADGAGGAFDVMVNEATIPVSVPKSSGAWQNVNSASIALPAGKVIIRLKTKHGGYNLKSMRFVAAD